MSGAHPHHGAQAAGGAAIEFDLLAGSFFDQVNAKFFTVGVTLGYRATERLR